jgi:hypothetical protein
MIVSDRCWDDGLNVVVVVVVYFAYVMDPSLYLVGRKGMICTAFAALVRYHFRVLLWTQTSPKDGQLQSLLLKYSMCNSS